MKINKIKTNKTKLKKSKTIKQKVKIFDSPNFDENIDYFMQPIETVIDKGKNDINEFDAKNIIEKELKKVNEIIYSTSYSRVIGHVKEQS